MKKLLSLFLCVLLLTGCTAAYDGPTESAQVLGETVTTYYYPIFGTVAYTEQTVYAYDIYGNQCQEYQYYNDELNRKITKTYDAAGNVLTERQKWKPDWLWEDIFCIESSYDSRNLPTARTIHSADNTYHFTWTYDAQGRPLTQDTNGSRETYTYDDANHTQTETRADGTLAFRQFREDGALLLEERTKADGTMTRREYTRRADGQPETIQTWENGILTGSETYTYDDQDRPIRHEVTGEQPSVTRWEYSDRQRTVYHPDGTRTVTGYDAEGRVRTELYYHADGILGHDTEYIYITIQVPAKEETP